MASIALTQNANAAIGFLGAPRSQSASGVAIAGPVAATLWRGRLSRPVAPASSHTRVDLFFM